MKSILIFLFVLFIPFYFFGNEIESKNIIADANALINETNILNNDIKTYTSDSVFHFHDVKLYAKSSMSYKANLGIGLGLLIPGCLLIFPIGVTLIPVGVVLMITPDQSYTWSNGDSASWVSAERFNAGLACTIIGGVCFITGAAFLITGAVNLGIANRKKHNRADKTTGSFALLIDYKSDFTIKKDEFILGAKYIF